RRSIQTVYYEILMTLTQLLSPIIPHTADEVWEYIPGDKAENVQLTDIPQPREVEGYKEIEEKWEHFMDVRADVLKALEEARNDKVIGKSLEAKITIVPKDEKTKEILESIEHLHQYLIVSRADVVDQAGDAKDYRYVSIAVEKHPGDKCDRCWVSSDTIGEDPDHPELCTRCATIVKEHYSA